MTKQELLDLLKKELIEEISKKNSWGKNELKEIVLEIFFKVMKEDLKNE